LRILLAAVVPLPIAAQVDAAGARESFEIDGHKVFFYAPNPAEGKPWLHESAQEPDGHNS